MRTSRYSRDSESQGIANVVILRNLNAASRTVQIQALELLRTNRIFTHTTVHNAPKLFLVVFLQSTSSDALVNHLSDHVFISHFHDPQDGFPNLEGESEWLGDDRASLSSSSVVRRSPSLNRKTARANRLGIEEIETLRTLKDKVTTSAEIKCYLQNVVTFLRLNRAVDGGVSARATQHFNLLTKYVLMSSNLIYRAAHSLQVSRSASRSGFCDPIAGCSGSSEGLSAPHSHHRPKE